MPTRASLLPIPALLAVWSAAALLISCNNPDPICRPGFIRAEDGHCYPPPPDPEPPSFEEAFESLVPCAPLKSGLEIDIVGACIEGACAQGSFSAFDVAFGPYDSCTETSAGDWDCLWPQGIAALFAPSDDDVGGPSDTAITSYVRARYLYTTGSTADGLGIGISVRCFIEAFGLPDDVDLVLSAGALVPQQLVWDALGLEIEDEERQVDLLAFPDGLVDEITLFGQ